MPCLINFLGGLQRAVALVSPCLSLLHNIARRSPGKTVATGTEGEHDAHSQVQSCAPVLLRRIAVFRAGGPKRVERQGASQPLRVLVMLAGKFNHDVRYGANLRRLRSQVHLLLLWRQQQLRAVAAFHPGLLNQAVENLPLHGQVVNI